MLSPRPNSNRPITTKSPTDQRTSAVNRMATKGSTNKDNRARGALKIFTKYGLDLTLKVKHNLD